MLVLYGTAIVLDLPTPAGTRYEQNLPASELAKWHATPNPTAEPAAHWWDKLQGLRGWSVVPEGWFWPKLPPPPLAPWLALLGLALLGIAGLRLVEGHAARGRRRVIWLALLALLAFGYTFQLGALWLKSPNVEQLLVDRITDANFTGYFTSALETDSVSAFFSNYDRTIISPNWCGHCRTHPPGPVLFYWLGLKGVGQVPLSLQQTLAGILAGAPRPDLSPAATIVASLGAHMILLSAAAVVFPLYGLARRLAGQELALPLAALGTVVPALVLMSPEFDQLYGTLAAGLVYLGVRGLQASHNNLWWGFGAGLFFAFSTYWSFGMLILAAPLVLLLVAAMAGRVGWRLPRRAALSWLLGLSLGSGLPWALLWSIGGFHLVSVLQTVRREQLGGITAIRPYDAWVVVNKLDFLQFLGLPLTVAALVTLVRRWRRGAFQLQNLNVFGLIFWVVLVLLDLSGTTRGEVSRVWIPLMPLAFLGVFHAARLGQLTASHVHALLGAQFVICVLIAGNWLTP
jgi:hypothetical protein